MVLLVKVLEWAGVLIGGGVAIILGLALVFVFGLMISQARGENPFK